ncbi:cytochrome P450 [Streptomyces sp. NBC_00878]|uniref:cytochrome P450 n=1 Tax=Streptomyces sp. NBC_00878 TaxID=2975854 RepID=UPI00224E3C3C|nr:cytochrome P450 [Streptomyces sp. NBC_00878]MCX4911789.1 cytochrome P450 [Streptomyces sp. NBC_00878]
MTDISETPAAAPPRRCPFDPQDAHLGLLHSGMVAPFELFGVQHWMVSRAEDVKAVTTDPRYSSALSIFPDAPEVPPGWFSGMDRPEHTRYRRLLADDFSLRAARAAEPTITELADRLLDDVVAAGPGADLVEAYANKLPSLVIQALYDLPDQLYADLDHAVSTLVAAQDLTTAATARQTIWEISARIAADKRSAPGDDPISRLVSADRADALTAEEATGAIATLAIAGHEAVDRLIAYGIHAFLVYPEQLAATRSGPAGWDGAVEELLRYLPVNQGGILRVAAEDIELRGQRIAAGDRVLPLFSTANRDPERYAEPDRFDVTRDASGNFAFGGGVHKCLGQHLARVEMKVAYSRLLDRLPGLRLADPDATVPMAETIGFYSPARLIVTW